LCGGRDDIAQQLEPAALQAGCKVGQAGDISARPGETADDTGADGIADRREHHGYAVCCGLGCLGRDRPETADEHIGRHLNQLGC
jgi:hypothetical protein